MSTVNALAKEIICKIVYYGPGLCGKTTNLEKIYEQLAPDKRSRLVSLATEEERTLMFDFLALTAGKINGYTLRFQILTVPGQVYYDAARRQVLMNADGLIFVADSQPERLEANIESMQNLYANARKLELDLSAIPIRLQYNKRDVPGALDIDTLQQALNFDGLPAYQAVARDGIGVFETLRDVMTAVEQNLRQRRR